MLKTEHVTMKMLNELKQEMVDEGLVLSEQMKTAEEEAAFKGESIGKVLVSSGMVSSDMMLKFIEKRLHIPFVKVDDYRIDEKVISRISPQVAQRFKVIPLFEIEGVLTVAMSDPADIISLDTVMRMTKCPVEVVISSESSIMSAINQWYGMAGMRTELVEDLVEEIKEIEEASAVPPDRGMSVIHAEQNADEQSVKKMVNTYIVEAVLEGASDIHLEPMKDSMLVRYRIDGFLYDRHQVPGPVMSALTSRVKIMSKLDISRKRVPQDGRIGLKIKERNVDIRISTFPSMHGENIVLRLLDKSDGVPELPLLGFSDCDLAVFRKMIASSKGIVLATGPTGSGKTTSLYSTINGLDKVNKNIMTVEDPIEYEIIRSVQCQVDLNSGVTFASALRAILRQDPDIIYVGEIRDLETAEIAVKAALTGHLVFSTLHANNAAGAVTRLIDMGVEQRLIGSVLNGSFAQRLVRKLCPECKEEYKPGEDLLESLALPADTRFFQARGCSFCNNIGYKGRTGIFELLAVNRDVRKTILGMASEDEIMSSARSHGMKNLFENGLEKVLEGKTTLEEIERVTLGVD